TILTLRSYFLLFAHGHHRDLHSFPTRRSSDLADAGAALPDVRCGAGALLVALLQLRAAAGVARHAEGDGRRVLLLRVAPLQPPRSEEHTSELQSRGHLVCRLLLEKKKKLVTLKLDRDNVEHCPFAQRLQDHLLVLELALVVCCPFDVRAQ